MDGALRRPDAAPANAPAPPAREANPDVGIVVGDATVRSGPAKALSLEHDVAEICEVAATVAMTAFTNVHPYFFTMTGARTGNPTAVAVGAALDTASELLSASPSLSDFVTARLGNVCELGMNAAYVAYERPESILETITGVPELLLDLAPATGAPGTINAPVGDLPPGGESAGSFDSYVPKDSFDGENHYGGSREPFTDPDSSSDSSPTPGTTPSEDWSGGGGGFSGGGASGGWGPQPDGSSTDTDISPR